MFCVIVVIVENEMYLILPTLSNSLLVFIIYPDVYEMQMTKSWYANWTWFYSDPDEYSVIQWKSATLALINNYRLSTFQLSRLLYNLQYFMIQSFYSFVLYQCLQTIKCSNIKLNTHIRQIVFCHIGNLVCNHTNIGILSALSKYL